MKKTARERTGSQGVVQASGPLVGLMETVKGALYELVVSASPRSAAAGLSWAM
jgi:hypothetical protein